MSLGLSPKYVGDLAATLSCYALMFASYYGWGEITARMLNLRRVGPRFPHLIWLGWAFALFALEAVHLMFAIDYRVSTLMFATGITVSFWVLPRRLLRNLKQVAAWHYLYICGVLASAIWIASHSMVPTQGDVGLYYLNTIRWINSYPIVPGLANLHGRLAFNQSGFVYAASLNFFPHFADGFRIGNGFLFLLLFSSLLWRLGAVLRKPREVLQADPLAHLPFLFILPAVVRCGLTDGAMGSAAADSISTILVLQMFLTMTQIVNLRHNSRLPDGTLQTLAVLGATAITIKLSNLAYAVTAFGIACYYFVRSTPTTTLAVAARFVVLPTLVICIWMARGYILSGVPFYPATVFRVPFDWAVPVETIHAEATKVYGWARLPGANYEMAVGNWRWLYPWFLRIQRMMVDVIHPVLFGLLMILLSIGAGIVTAQKRKLRFPAEQSLVVLPSVLGLVYWFLTAPDPRFATSQFWTLAAGGSLLCLSQARGCLPRRWYAPIVVFIFLGMNLPVMRNVIRNPEHLKSISTVGFIPFRSPLVVQKQTLSGLTLFMPAPERKDNSKCWDSPLPCTPRFNPHLQLRKTGLRSGFTVAQQH
jgi:energy-converting hydrogenase Eha subunit C